MLSASNGCCESNAIVPAQGYAGFALSRQIAIATPGALRSRTNPSSAAWTELHPGWCAAAANAGDIASAGTMARQSRRVIGSLDFMGPPASIGRIARFVVLPHSAVLRFGDGVVARIAHVSPAEQRHHHAG